MKKGLTLLLSLVLVLAMSVTAFAAEDWVTPVQNIEKWDEEVDFLVVGYGRKIEFFVIFFENFAESFKFFFLLCG